ncbi:MAG: hypothetical protein ACOVQ4_20245 [Flectobacillus sp.]
MPSILGLLLTPDSLETTPTMAETVYFGYRMLDFGSVIFYVL